MPCFYLQPKQDDANQTPELQVCIAEALYDIESILSDPGALLKEEIRTLRDQIASNLERAWELTGGSEDQLTADFAGGRRGSLRNQKAEAMCLCLSWLSLNRNHGAKLGLVCGIL